MSLDFLDTVLDVRRRLFLLELLGRFDCLRVGNDGTSVGVSSRLSDDILPDDDVTAF